MVVSKSNDESKLDISAHADIENLVFEGGGVKGIAYLGALKEFEHRGILQNIKRLGGTSAGAITALLLGLRYSLEEIHQIAFNLDFNKFADDGLFVSDLARLVNKFGWHRGDFFHNWAKLMVAKKLGTEKATFLDAKKAGCLDMHFIGTNLSTGYAEIYSVRTTPNMMIADAVRISMSIPLYFSAMRNENQDVLVDGGAILNYPIKLFDKGKGGFNHNTVGFRLDSKTEIGVLKGRAKPKSHKIRGLKSYITRLVETLIAAQDSVHLHSDDWRRTVYIDCLDVAATDFEISNYKKKKLVQQGRGFTAKYLDWRAENYSSISEIPDA